MTSTDTLTITDFIKARVAWTPERVTQQAEDGDDLHPPGEPCSFCEPTWAARRLVGDLDLSPASLTEYEQRALASVWSDHPDYRQDWKP